MDIGKIVVGALCVFLVGGASSFVTNVLTTQELDDIANANAVQAAEDAEVALLKYADKAFINGVCGGEKCGFRIAYRPSPYSNPSYYRVTNEGVVIREGVGLAEHLPRMCTGLPVDEQDRQADCRVIPAPETVAEGD